MPMREDSALLWVTMDLLSFRNIPRYICNLILGNQNGNSVGCGMDIC